MDKKTLVLDMGGSSVKAGLFYGDKLFKTETWRHEYAVLEQDAALAHLKKSIFHFFGKDFDHIGLGIAGLLACDGSLFRSTVLIAFTGLNIGELLKDYFSAINFIEDNDADCGAIGEYSFVKKDLLYIVVGSGIGSACVDGYGNLLYRVRIEKSVPFSEEMNHPISDIGLMVKVNHGKVAKYFKSCGAECFIPHSDEEIRLGNLGSAVGVSNILKALWKDNFDDPKIVDYYRQYLKDKPELFKDLFSKKYGAKTIAFLAKCGEPKSILAYRLMGRFLGLAISEAEKILFKDQGRFFPVYLSGEIINSRELFWADMEHEISRNKIRTSCFVSKASQAVINANLLGAFLRVQKNNEGGALEAERKK
jgi:hypothetical protein